MVSLPRPPFCVGFAAESEKLAQNAKEKRARKKVPLLAANIAQDALGAEDNSIVLFDERFATAIETDLLRIQAEILHGRRDQMRSQGQPEWPQTTPFRVIETPVPLRNESAKGEAAIHSPTSRVQLWIMPTNEELIVARQAQVLLAAAK